MALVYRRSEPKEDIMGTSLSYLIAVVVGGLISLIHFLHHHGHEESDRRDAEEEIARETSRMKNLDRELERLNAELERNPGEN
jgi:hypothetical protein